MSTKDSKNPPSIIIVIPAFEVADQIISVIHKIDKSVTQVIVVDDLCPEKSGLKVTKNIKDKRVKVLFNESNLGVGGSMIRGYKEAMKSNPKYVVKLDGDGQMDPKLIPFFISELENFGGDYAKGNRFADPENLKIMPRIRIFGNLVLSFFAKFSTGYWNIFDPNNGFTVIKGETLARVPLHKINERYFFESDMLFRLNLIGAHVVDVPMTAVYGTEKSNINLAKTLFEFPTKHLKNFLKRIIYNYFLRDFNLASIELLAGLNFLFIATLIGAINFMQAIREHSSMSVGILVLVSILIISGLQLILSFLAFDMNIRNQKRPG
jgi:glycosyltransferase involved in cell wall biosynthesis